MVLNEADSEQLTLVFLQVPDRQLVYRVAKNKKLSRLNAVHMYEAEATVVAALTIFNFCVKCSCDIDREENDPAALCSVVRCVVWCEWIRGLLGYWIE
jgi:hypothetical protein